MACDGVGKEAGGKITAGHREGAGLGEGASLTEKVTLILEALPTERAGRTKPG